MKLIFLLLIICFCGCNKPTNFRKLLVQGDSTFWDEYNNNRIKVSSLLFKKNGECIPYDYNKHDSLIAYDEGGGVTIHKWDIVSDTIYFDMWRRKIIYMDNDSMAVEDLKHNDVFIFKRKK